MSEKQGTKFDNFRFPLPPSPPPLFPPPPLLLVGLYPRPLYLRRKRNPEQEDGHHQVYVHSYPTLLVTVRVCTMVMMFSLDLELCVP